MLVNNCHLSTSAHHDRGRARRAMKPGLTLHRAGGPFDDWTPPMDAGKGRAGFSTGSRTTFTGWVGTREPPATGVGHEYSISTWTSPRRAADLPRTGWTLNTPTTPRTETGWPAGWACRHRRASSSSSAKTCAWATAAKPERTTICLERTYTRTGATILGKRMFDGGEQFWPEGSAVPHAGVSSSPPRSAHHGRDPAAPSSTWSTTASTPPCARRTAPPPAGAQPGGSVAAPKPSASSSTPAWSEHFHHLDHARPARRRHPAPRPRSTHAA